MNIRRYAFIALLILAGCTPLEAGRRFIGISVQSLQECEKRYEQVVNKKYVYCYEHTLQFFQDMKVKVHLKSIKKHYIVAMNFDKIYKESIDTTEVGVFFEEDTSGQTKISVTSRNSDLAEFVSIKLFESFQADIEAEPVPGGERKDE